MKIFSQIPENKIEETWQFQTDIIVADDGTEQRIQLREYPKRSFNLMTEYDSVADVRLALIALLSAGEVVQLPLYQYMTRLTTVATVGATEIDFVAARTDLRDGDKAYVFDHNGGEVVTLDGLVSNGSGLEAALSRTYHRRSWVAPVRNVYSANSASLERRNVDGSASLQTTFFETGFPIPFVTEFNTAELTMFAGLAVLERNAMGSKFGQAFDGGFEVFDFGGIVELRKSWEHAQVQMTRDFLCQRQLTPTDWDYWRVFADYCRGSCNPFFVPTYREDFEVYTAPAPSGTTLTFEGIAYADDFWPLAPFKQLAIVTEAGIHYATVTSVAKVAGRTNVIFTPALPAGASWANDQSISMLMKVRIADDKVTCYHYNLHSEISLTMRTVDE